LRAPRAALLVVGDDQRVLVEHRALEARVRTHVLAHLLAQVAGVAVGGEAIEEHPERLPGAERQRQRLVRQRADRREEAHEGEAGPQRERHPQDLLGALAQQLVGVPRPAVQLETRRAIALGAALHPQEGLGPHGLRAGVTAPQPPAHRREEEQRQGGDDQQPGEEDKILRPEHQAEDEELARRQVEQHGLAAVPFEPRE
jgi:hypothetical protein